MSSKIPRKPTVKFELDKRNPRRGMLTVGGFRVAVEPTGEDVADLGFSGSGFPSELLRLGMELRCASVHWQSDGFIFDALRSRYHTPGMADGDVLARVGYVDDDPSRVVVTLAMASDLYVESDVVIASMADGRYALTSEAAGFEPAQMGALGSIFETVGRVGAVGDLLATVRAAASGCGCEDLDDALAESQAEDMWCH